MNWRWTRLFRKSVAQPPAGRPATVPAAPFKHLVPGRRYHIIKPFKDYDRSRHEEGESWTYLGHSFLPYEDGLTLFISLDGNEQSTIRLQWVTESQGEIIDNLASYVQAS